MDTPPTPEAGPDESGKIRDFGEKIGGARKNIRGKLNRDDLARLNPAERVKLCRKDMVWPTPDYAALAAVGTGTHHVDAVAVMKLIRDAIPTAPSGITARDFDTEETKTKQGDFIEFVRIIRAICETRVTVGQIAEGLRTSAELQPFLEITRTGERINRQQGLGLPVRYYHQIRFTNKFHGMFDRWRETRELVSLVGQVLEGSKDDAAKEFRASNPRWPYATGAVEAWLEKQRLGVYDAAEQGGQLEPLWRVGNFRAVGLYRRAYGDEVQRGEHFYTPSLAFTPRSLSSMLHGDENRDLFVAKFPGVAENRFPTQAAAQAALLAYGEVNVAVRVAAQQLKRGATQPKAKQGLAADFERVGPDRRNGRAATPQDYLALGLRGGEFGLWVKDSERQGVLDNGYDAFADLADTFGWPMDTLALGGTLAIAFGSRGGGHYAAHYEPMRTVINLTKPKGAGALAHEWGHALDHYLGNIAAGLGWRTPAGAGNKYIDCGISYFSEMQPPAMFTPRGDEAQTALSGFLLDLHRAMFAPVHALVNDYLQSDRTSAWDFETKIKAAVTRAVGRTKITWFVHNLGIRTSEINAWRNRFDEIRRGDQAVLDQWVVKRKTGYKTDADKMDAGRSESSGPYWGLKLELFARAFEAITADTAHAKNLASPFLVPPQCNNALWQTGKPYPEGEEREAFVKSFVPLLRELPLYIEKPRQTAVDLTQVKTSRAASVAGP